MAASSSSGCLRASALLTVVLGLFLLHWLPGLVAAAGYLGVLAGLGATIALLAGIRIWFTGCLLARTLAATVACCCLGAQLLDRALGLPGRSNLDRPSDLALLVVLGLVLTMAGLMVADSRRRPARPATAAPYAMTPPA
jgi:hypothetical protein